VELQPPASRSYAYEGCIFIRVKSQCHLLMSGVNPQSIRGSRTGVFIGRSLSEAHDAWTAADVDQITGYETTGCVGTMVANRLSYFFDFRGLYCHMKAGYTTRLLLLLLLSI